MCFLETLKWTLNAIDDLAKDTELNSDSLKIVSSLVFWVGRICEQNSELVDYLTSASEEAQEVIQHMLSLYMNCNTSAEGEQSSSHVLQASLNRLFLTLVQHLHTRGDHPVLALPAWSKCYKSLKSFTPPSVHIARNTVMLLVSSLFLGVKDPNQVRVLLLQNSS